jgi:CheY-like chemotaxis protein
VDDEEQFRATTDKILTRRGFDTIMAESGEVALEKLGQNPDVIILDINMEGMDGHETLREIKKRRQDVPVIMLTGHGALPSAHQAYAEGAFDYLSKPCDIDVLTGKIKDAYNKGKARKPHGEKEVKDIMIPISEYTTLSGELTVRDAVLALKKSFSSRLSTSRIMETGHRSVLVFDEANRIIGVLAIVDLMEMILPQYLSAPKPSMADSIQYSPMFWKGMFTIEMKQKMALKIKDVMSPAPNKIDGSASLMEATYMMVKTKPRRLLVMVAGEAAGVVREQDLFFEMEKILQT